MYFYLQCESNGLLCREILHVKSWKHGFGSTEQELCRDEIPMILTVKKYNSKKNEE